MKQHWKLWLAWVLMTLMVVTALPVTALSVSARSVSPSAVVAHVNDGIAPQTAEERDVLNAAVSKVKAKYHPVFGTDTNLLDMVRASIEDERVTVAMKNAVTGQYSAIDLDGSLHYYFRDPFEMSFMHFEWLNNVPLTLSVGEESADVSTRARMYWDQERVKAFILDEEAPNDKKVAALITDDVVKGENPSLENVSSMLILPAYPNRNAYGTIQEYIDHVSEDQRNHMVRWTAVTWRWEPDDPSHQNVIKVSDEYRTGNTDQIMYAPYVGQVTPDANDVKGKMIASFTFNYFNVDPVVTIEKSFDITVPGTGPVPTPEENMQRILNAQFTVDKIYEFGTKTPIDPKAVTTDLQLPIARTLRQGATGDDKKIINNCKFSYASDHPAIKVTGFRGNTVRPLPSEAPVEVTLTVTMTGRSNASIVEIRDVSVQKEVVLTVLPLQLAELQEAAQLMDQAIDYYPKALLGDLTDPNNVNADLSNFQEMHRDDDGNMVVIRNHSDRTYRGIIPDSLDPEHLQEQYNLFRSSHPSIIAHENLLYAQPEYNTNVTIDSVLTHEVYQTYAEKLPEPTDDEDEATKILRSLLKRPVSATFRVPGRIDEDDPEQNVKGTLIVEGSKIITTQAEAEAPDVMETWLEVEYSLPKGATLEDLTRAVINEDAGHTLVFQGHFLTTIGIKDKGTNTGGVTNGPESAWLWYLKADGEDTFTLGPTMANQYTIQSGDTFKWAFRNDPRWPFSVAEETPSQPIALVPTSAWWASFRGDLTTHNGKKLNMPVSEPTRTLAWDAFIEEVLVSDWGTFPASISDLLIVNDKLFYAADTHLVRIDLKTGEREAVANLRASIQYFSRLAYQYGMIVVPLNGGGVQAIDPLTMETQWVTESMDSLLVYREQDDHTWDRVALPLQSTGTTLISDGIAYIPLSAIEGYQPTAGYLRAIDMSTGQELWGYQNDDAAFYWSGAVAVDQKIIIGDDQGRLYAFNKDGSNVTAPTVVRIGNAGAAVRSTPVKDGDRLYFTTTDGTFHSIKTDLTDHKTVQFAQHSTSTPVIHDGKAYVGGDNGGAWGEQKGIFAVIDIQADPMKATPHTVGDGGIQSSPLLVTDPQGKVFVYFTANAKEGTLYVYTDGKVMEAYVPTQPQANYTLSSPVVDKQGHVYYTTDAGVILSLQCGKQEVEYTITTAILNVPFIPQFEILSYKGELLSNCVLELSERPFYYDDDEKAHILEQLDALDDATEPEDFRALGIRLQGDLARPFHGNLKLVVDTEKFPASEAGTYRLYRLNNNDELELIARNAATNNGMNATEATFTFSYDFAANDTYILAAMKPKTVIEPTEPDPTKPEPTQPVEPSVPEPTTPQPTAPVPTTPVPTEPEPTPTDPVAPPKTGESELYVLYALLLFAAAGAVTLGHRVVKQRQR